ncbi:MAG TPA: hypothetical protein VJZ71_09930 [Phycisphaerae bacterium]|nr:hypothetical protein [Phycisphaerae bacterium]
MPAVKTRTTSRTSAIPAVGMGAVSKSAMNASKGFHVPRIAGPPASIGPAPEYRHVAPPHPSTTTATKRRAIPGRMNAIVPAPRPSSKVNWMHH